MASVQQIQQALDTLLNSSDNVARSNANKYLMEFQNTPEAWDVSQGLVAAENENYQFMGFQILHSKIKNEWIGLSDTQRQGLMQALIAQVPRFARSPHVSNSVFPKLASTLGALAARTIPHLWANPVGDYLGLVAQQPDRSETEAIQQAVLILITCLCEEVRSLDAKPSRKEEILVALTRREVQRPCIDFIKNIIAAGLGNPGWLHVRALACMTEWCEMNDALQPSSEMVSQELLPMMFACLSQQRLFQSASDALSTLLHRRAVKPGQGVVDSVLIPVLSSHQEYIHGVNNGDDDICRTLCHLVCAVIEGQMETVCQTSHPACQQILDYLLMMTEHKTLDIAEHTLYIWYLLSEEENKGLVGPLFMRLAPVLLRQACYPPNFTTSWDTLDVDEAVFTSFRMQLGDTLLYTYEVIGEAFLEGLCGSLLETAQGALQGGGGGEALRGQWKQLESLVFAVGAVAESLPLTEASWLPRIFELLPRIADTHEIVRDRCLRCICNHCDWFASSPAAQALVYPLTLFASTSIARPQTVRSACEAVDALTSSCAAHLSQYWVELSRFWAPALESLHGRPRVLIYRATAAIACSTSDTSAIPARLEPLLHVCTTRIATLVSSTPDKTSRSSLLTELGVADGIRTSVDSGDEGDTTDLTSPATALRTRILSRLLTLLWQAVRPIFSSPWVQDSEVMEKASHVIATLIHDSNMNSIEILGDIITTVVSYFTETVRDDALRVVRASVVQYGASFVKRGDNSFVMLLDNISTRVMQALSTDGLQKHSLALGAYFTVLNSTLAHCPTTLFSLENLNTIWEVVIASFVTESRQASVAIVAFITSFYSGKYLQQHPEFQNTVAAIFQQSGPRLISVALGAVASPDFPRARLLSVGKVLHLLTRDLASIADTRAHVTSILQSPTFGGPLFDDNTRAMLAQGFYQQQGRRFEMFIQTVGLICRSEETLDALVQFQG